MNSMVVVDRRGHPQGYELATRGRTAPETLVGAGERLIASSFVGR
jgi:hypothetical protein